MIIVDGCYPPNMAMIRKYLNPTHDVIFAYGDRIFNPQNTIIPRELIVHEEVHFGQMGNVPSRIEEWWLRYCLDKPFRLAQEIPAHQAEYRDYVKQGHGRSARRWRLRLIAKRMSGRLYGNLISLADARRLISKRD